MVDSPYLTDEHTLDDALNFSDFRPALAQIILTARTPLTVGVFGAWGTGKTSLLRMLQGDVETQGLPRLRPVWFTAWKYDHEDALWRAFLLRVLDALQPREAEPAAAPRAERPRLKNPVGEQARQVALLERLEESVYRPVDWQELGRWTLDWLALARQGGAAAAELAEAFIPMPGLLKTALQLAARRAAPEAGAADALRREVRAYRLTQLTYLEQFEQRFREALRLILRPDGRLIVFVDDLDRCLPEKAVEVLEAIKLFLAVEGVVFVLGMDREVIRRGIETRYRALFQAGHDKAALPLQGDDYLQKLVQIPFHLPPLSQADVEGFVHTQAERSGQAMSELTRQVFARGLAPNPRQIKRALNIFQLVRAIAEERIKQNRLGRLAVAEALLAKTVAIQTQYPEFYEAWRRYPTLAQTYEDAVRRQPMEEAEHVRGRRLEGLEPAVGGDGEGRRGGLLEYYLGDRERYALLERMMRYPEAPVNEQTGERGRFEGLSRDEMAVYVHLAGSVAAEAPWPEPAAGLLAELLSGDLARVRDAAARLAPADRPAYARRLAQVVESAAAGVTERVSAGDALGLIGDPRPGVGWTIRDGVKIPDIAWGEVVPVGTYKLGGDEEAEQPKRRTFSVERPYQLARYPVTYAQFRCFVEAADFGDERWWRGMPARGQDWPGDEHAVRAVAAPRSALDNRPRDTVSWYQAVAFCRWLSAQLGETIELPTEDEWEAAARYPDGRFYPWGNEFDPSKANTEASGLGQSSAVGVFPEGRSALGLYDLSGNVWEWCRNKYDKPTDDKIDGSGAGRVLRGGSWELSHDDARAADRDRHDPDARDMGVGFRVVRRPPSHPL